MKREGKLVPVRMNWKKIVEFIGKCVKKCEFCINIQEQKDNEIEKLVEKKSAHVLDLRWTVNQ